MKAIRFISITSLFMFGTLLTTAQNVGIGTLNPEASALLDISSTTKGLLPPRMTFAQREVIASPTTGLLIYQTDNSSGFYFYNGNAWKPLTGENTGTGLNHYIGENYGGGVIFHLWKDDQGTEHGLIVAHNDQSIEQPWSNVTTSEIGSSAQSTWNGSNNSAAIVGQSGHSSSAASLAKSHSGGNNNDWYLPAIDELNLLFNNRFNVNKTLSVTNGAKEIGTNTYWSSTVNFAYDAWAFDFGNNGTYNTGKSDAYYVRAVRAF